jgi:hypothetical protein
LISNIKFEENNVNKNKEKIPQEILPEFNINGLKVIVDSQEVLRISRDLFNYVLSRYSTSFRHYVFQ